MTQSAFTLYRIAFDPTQKCPFSLAFALYRCSFDPIQKCPFSLAFALYRCSFDPIQKCPFSLAFALYRCSFDPTQKCPFSLAFALYRCSFGAVQVQNCSSFLAGTKLYLIAGTKLYRITLYSVNAASFSLSEPTYHTCYKYLQRCFTDFYMVSFFQNLHHIIAQNCVSIVA